MKRMFIALLAMVAFVACEKTEDGIFAFDKEGNCIDKAGREVSAEEFAQKAVGFCWKRNAWYEINNDGIVSGQEYHKGWYGFSPTEYYYFIDNSNVKCYIWNGADPVGDSGYYKFSTYGFIDSEIYFEDEEKALYQVLEIVDDSMTVIMQQAYIDNGIPKMRYFLTTLTKLTEEKHQEIEERYWMNWDEK